MFKVILLVLVCATNTVVGQDRITVLSESWPPFIYHKDGEVIGLVAEKVREVLDLTKLEYQIKLLPWARSYQLARSTPNTLIFSIFRSPEREVLFHWFCPIMPAEQGYLYRLAQNPYYLASLQDIRQYRIGVMREDLSHQFLRDNGFIERVNLDLSADEDINIKKLFNGRVDFVVQSPSAIKFRLNALGLSPDVVVAERELMPGNKQQHCMALNIDSDPALVKHLQATFEQWTEHQNAHK
ncbi:substrate-binding periplasmic protein [Thalassotalea fusca]